MRLTAAAVALAAAAAPALAGPLNLDVVPADATWVVHLDVEAVTSGTVGRYVLEHADELGIEEHLEECRNETGLDATRDVYGVTLFGEGDPQQTGVAVLVTSDAIDRVLEEATEEDGATTVEQDGYELTRWSKDDTAVYLHVEEAPRGRRTVTISGNKALVVDALKVHDGRITSMKEAGRDEMRPGRGSMLYARGRGLPWIQPEEEAVAALLRRTNRMELDVRDDAGTTSARLLVSARSIEDATNISQVLQGGVALIRLIASQQPELDGMIRLLSSVSFFAERNDVELLFTAPSEQIVQMLEMHR